VTASLSENLTAPLDELVIVDIPVTMFGIGLLSLLYATVCIINYMQAIVKREIIFPPKLRFYKIKKIMFKNVIILN